MIPSSTDLSYFLEVAQLSNLSRAAESLGITQPSLTLAMQRLEKSVGTPILIRHKRGVTLTKAGKQLLAYTRQLLQHWDTIKSETLASTHEIQGCFTIGCHPSVAAYTLPRFLAELMEKYPKLEIKLRHDLSRKIVEEVSSFGIDIGIAVNPVKMPDLVIQRLFQDKIRLWRSEHGRRIQDFNSGEAIILCDLNLLQTQHLLKKLKKNNLNFARLIPSCSLEVIVDLTKSGCGIGILPENIAHPRNLLPVPKTPFYQDEICLVYHGENRNVRAIQVINSAIKGAFKPQV